MLRILNPTAPAIAIETPPLTPTLKCPVVTPTITPITGSNVSP